MINELKENLSYEPESGVIRWAKRNGTKKCGEVAGTITKNGYVHIRFRGRKILGHRVAWLITHGDWPADQIDHINDVKTDNRISNLRVVNNSQNNQRKKTPKPLGASGFYGVSPYKGKFQAKITTNYKTKSLGTFESAADASEFYQLAKEMIHFS